MRSPTPVARFWRSYIVSEVILIVSVYSGIIRDSLHDFEMSWALAGIIMIVIITLVPLVPTGRSRIQRRIGTVTSGLLSVVCAVVLALVSEEFKVTGGEGPNGEGSPLAAIMAMATFTLFFTIPWTITLVRGVASWNIQEAEQAAADRPLPAAQFR